MRRRALALLAVLFTACPPPAPPELELNKSALDFGTVEVNAGPFRLPLVLTNLGDTPLRFKTLQLQTESDELSLEANFTDLASMERRVAIVLFRPTREGPVTGELHIDPQDGKGERVVTIAGFAGTLSATVRPEQGIACALDFGTVTSGSRVTRRLTVDSTGTVPITVIKADSSLTEAGFAFDGPFGLPIEPGQSAEFTVSLDPLKAGALSSQLSLITNSAQTPKLTVTGCADARVPLLCATPAEVDLGALPTGMSASSMIRAENCGNLPLTVTAVALAQPTTGAFTLSMVPAVPRTLAPGEQFDVAIALTSSSELATRTRVRLASNSLVTPELFVSVGANLPPPCSLKLSPSTLSLYALTPRGSVRVTNTGSTDCLIQRIEVVPATAPFSLEREVLPPIVLNRRQSLELPVLFTPATMRTESAKLEVEVDFVRSMTLKGSTNAPPGCRLQAGAAFINFGTSAPSMPVTTTLPLTNLGAGQCNITRITATDPEVSASVNSTRLNSGDSVTLSVTFAPTPQRTSRVAGSVLITSNDAFEPTIDLKVMAGRFICDPNCMCTGEEVLAHWRFADIYTGSGISPAGEAGAIAHSCEPNPCMGGDVLVEVAREQLECTPAPMDCPDGQDLDWDGVALKCVECDVVVQYGGIFDSERVCAPRPNVSCGGGSTPTFDHQQRQWQCAPTCNNGLYDQRYLDGQLVCVPC